MLDVDPIFSLTLYYLSLPCFSEYQLISPGKSEVFSWNSFTFLFILTKLSIVFIYTLQVLWNPELYSL